MNNESNSLKFEILCLYICNTTLIPIYRLEIKKDVSLLS